MKKRINRGDMPTPNLNNIHYVKLYALMVSEGSYKTEFKLHVPEKEFHEIFRNSLKNLFSKKILRYIKGYQSRGILALRAPQILRYLIPIPQKIPELILKNKSYAKEYLKIAFEAEGSAILTKNKRYIKLSRNTNISNFINDINIPKEKRIFIGILKKRYPKFLNKIYKFPPVTLIGEHLILKNLFNINSTLRLESIRLNKTSFRCGKLSAKWVLYIYANNINKFIENIGFISKRKNNICKKMLKISQRKQQFSTFKIINNIQKNSFFTRKIFCKEMAKLGYKSPHAYLWRYQNKRFIKRIKRGYYKIIYQPIQSSLSLNILSTHYPSFFRNLKS